MALNLTDLFMLQLAQQAAWYDLNDMDTRSAASREVADFFTYVFRDTQSTCAIEVGAHEASYSCTIKNKFPAAKAFAYEGNPHVWKKYIDPLTKQGINYINSLVADKCGEQEINILASIDGKAEPQDGKRHSILPRIDNNCIAEKITMPCITLDSVFSKPEFADERFSLWIDAEGAMREVLMGAENILNRVAAIYVEVESLPKFETQAVDKDIVEYLIERDFVPVLRDFQFWYQYNIIFVHKSYYANISATLHRFIQFKMRDRINNLASMRNALK